MLPDPPARTPLPSRSLRSSRGLALCAAWLLVVGVAAAPGCGGDDDGTAEAAGSAGAEADAGEQDDVSAGGSGAAGASGSDASTDAPSDSGAEAAVLGGSCESLPCVAGTLCTEDPCSADFCPQTCKKEVASCAVSPSPCASGEVCVTSVTYPTLRSYCIPEAKAFAPCDPVSWKTCIAGYYCAKAPSDPFGSVCLSRSDEGKSCTNEPGGCKDGLRCLNGACASRKELGALCVGSGECLEGLFCAEDTGQCEAVHPVGGKCRAGNAVCKGSNCLYLSPYCAEGLVCDDSGVTGCFHDTNCSDAEPFCCGAPDAGATGVCGTEFKCLRPEGVCAKAPAP